MKIKELHLGKYEISNEDKITRIHFSSHMQDDRKLRVKFMERSVPVRNGSHDILFYHLQSLQLAEHYYNDMKNIINDLRVEKTGFTDIFNYISDKSQKCDITAYGGNTIHTKEEFLEALEKSFKELTVIIKNKQSEKALEK